jgi:hypothetical protein
MLNAPTCGGFRRRDPAGDFVQGHCSSRSSTAFRATLQ